MTSYLILSFYDISNRQVQLTITVLFIYQTKDNEIRTLEQYHYLSWPDHGVPQFPSDILSFRNKIRKDHPIDMARSPMLIHCR